MSYGSLKVGVSEREWVGSVDRHFRHTDRQTAERANRQINLLIRSCGNWMIDKVLERMIDLRSRCVEVERMIKYQIKNRLINRLGWTYRQSGQAWSGKQTNQSFLWKLWKNWWATRKKTYLSTNISTDRQAAKQLGRETDKSICKLKDSVLKSESVKLKDWLAVRHIGRQVDI